MEDYSVFKCKQTQYSGKNKSKKNPCEYTKKVVVSTEWTCQHMSVKRPGNPQD